MKLGLLFGSFNPIHKGHIAIAEAGLKDAGCNEVWFMIQEYNPYKQQHQLASLDDRLEMVRLATQGNDKFKVVVTKATSMATVLDNLKAHYSDSEFVLLMGQDLVSSLPTWEDSNRIINRYQIFGYERSNEDSVSSELIRKRIKTGADIGSLTPSTVQAYIRKAGLYG